MTLIIPEKKKSQFWLMSLVEVEANPDGTFGSMKLLKCFHPEKKGDSPKKERPKEEIKEYIDEIEEQ